MKNFKYLIFCFIAAGIFFSCSQNEKKPTETGNDHSKDVHYKSTNINDNGLQLNNGEKWQADAPTHTSFNNMQKITSDFGQKNPKPGIADYNTLGSNIQAELDNLFNSCKMDGEAHEQLHTLLKMIIADVRSLKETEEKAAAEAYTNLQQHLALFPQYFK